MQSVEKYLLRFLNKYGQVEKKSLVFAGVNLHPVEIHTLCFIDKRGGSFVSEIARETGVTRGAVSQVVSKLEKKGLVEKVQDTANKSRLILQATDKGKECSLDHETMHKNMDDALFSYLQSLDADHLALIEELYRKMDCWMDNYLEPD